jgi:hypothetical protein
MASGQSSASQEAPTKIFTFEDLDFISRHRIPFIESGSMFDSRGKKNKHEEKIISIKNVSGFNPKIHKHVVKNCDLSIETRKFPESENFTLKQVYFSFSKSKRVIIPESRILQIINSQSRKCNEFRKDIFATTSHAVNFFVKIKSKKIDNSKRIFVYRLIMTKGGDFDVKILDLDSPENVKGQLVSVDISTKK